MLRFIEERSDMKNCISSYELLLAIEGLDAIYMTLKGEDITVSDCFPSLLRR